MHNACLPPPSFPYPGWSWSWRIRSVTNNFYANFESPDVTEGKEGECKEEWRSDRGRFWLQNDSLEIEKVVHVEKTWFENVGINEESMFSLSFIPFMLTNKWLLEYNQIKLSPRLNCIRTNSNSCVTRCKLSIIHDDRDLSFIFSFVTLFIFVTASNFPGRGTIIS